MKNLRIAVLSLAVTSGCTTSPEHPGYAWYPDMFASLAAEALDEYPVLPDSAVRLLPPEGTIPWGADTFVGGLYRYPFPNTFAGYDSAGKHLKNPLKPTNEVLARGKELYNIYCAPCHGEQGDGKGKLVQLGKYPPPPPYNSERFYMLSDGHMFHSITYGTAQGQGIMGSFAAQLTPTERWAIITYIRTQLQNRKSP